MMSYVPSSVSIPLGSVSLYDASKQRRRFPFWRTWNRLSKLQRYLVCCGAVLLTLFAIARLSASVDEQTYSESLLPEKVRGELVEELPKQRHIQAVADIILGKGKIYGYFFEIKFQL